MIKASNGACCMLDTVKKTDSVLLECARYQTIYDLRWDNKYQSEEDCQSSQISASILQKTNAILNAIQRQDLHPSSPLYNTLHHIFNLFQCIMTNKVKICNSCRQTAQSNNSLGLAVCSLQNIMDKVNNKGNVAYCSISTFEFGCTYGFDELKRDSYCTNIYLHSSISAAIFPPYIYYQSEQQSDNEAERTLMQEQQ